MKKPLLPLILFAAVLIGCKRKTFIVGDDYYFPNYNGQVIQFHQSTDTIYEYNFQFQRAADRELLHRYKIQASTVSSDYNIVKLEEITSVDTVPDLRFFAFVFKKYNDGQLGYLNYARHYSKSEIDTLNVNVDLLDIAFYYTYYNNVQFDQIMRQKPVASYKDAVRIIKVLSSDRFNKLAKQYADTDLPDFYGNGFAVEVVNRICIELGYNPCGSENKLREVTEKQQ